LQALELVVLLRDADAPIFNDWWPPVIEGSTNSRVQIAAMAVTS
jgi:hypothetical protein